jgi:hypothetical protein
MKLKLTEEQFSELDYQINNLSINAIHDPGDGNYDIKLNHVSISKNPNKSLMVQVSGNCRSYWYEFTKTDVVPLSITADIDLSTEEWNYIGSCYSEMEEWCSEVSRTLKYISIEKIKKTFLITFTTEWEDKKYIYEQDWKYKF